MIKARDRLRIPFPLEQNCSLVAPGGFQARIDFKSALTISERIFVLTHIQINGTTSVPGFSVVWVEREGLSVALGCLIVPFHQSQNFPFVTPRQWLAWV